MLAALELSNGLLQHSARLRRDAWQVYASAALPRHSAALFMAQLSVADDAFRLAVELRRRAWAICRAEAQAAAAGAAAPPA